MTAETTKHLALDAGPHTGSPGGAPGRGGRVRLLRRHRSGPDRHVDGARPSARSGRIAWRDLHDHRARPDRAGRHPPVDRDGRADPRSARCADHVRIEGGVVGRRGPAPHRAAGSGPRPLARRSARWGGRHPRVLRRRTALGSGPCSASGSVWPIPEFRGSPAAIGSPSSASARRWSLRPWPASAGRCTSCSARRSASWASRRAPTPSAASPCRTSAIPSAASTSTRWPAWSGPTPACCSRPWCRPTSATDGRGRPSGPRSPRSACSPRPRCASASTWSAVWSSTPTRCAGTSTRATATWRRNRCSAPCPAASASTGPRRCCRRRSPRARAGGRSLLECGGRHRRPAGGRGRPPRRRARPRHGRGGRRRGRRTSPAGPGS